MTSFLPSMKTDIKNLICGVRSRGGRRGHMGRDEGDPLHAVEGMYVAFIFANWEMISKPLEFYAVCLFVWGIFGHRLVQQQHAKRLTVRPQHQLIMELVW